MPSPHPTSPILPPRQPPAPVVGIAAVAFLLALRVDTALVRLVHAHTGPAIDRAAHTLSGLASAELATLAGLGLLGTGQLVRMRGLRLPPGQAEAMVRGGTLLLCTLASGGAATWLLKHLAARARPELLVTQGFNGLGLPFAGHPYTSFPSSHAFTAFAVAAVAGLLRPALHAPLLALALGVAACRVLALEHYPSDVAFSALVAYGCARFWAARTLPGQAAWPLRRPWGR